MMNLLTNRQAERVGKVVRAHEASRGDGRTPAPPPGVSRAHGIMPWKNVGTVTIPLWGVVKLGDDAVWQTQAPLPQSPGNNRQVIAGQRPTTVIGRYGVNLTADVAANGEGYVQVTGLVRVLVSGSASNGHYGPTPNSHLLQPNFPGGFDEMTYVGNEAPGPYAWVILHPILATWGVALANILAGNVGSVNIQGFTTSVKNALTVNVSVGQQVNLERILDRYNDWRIAPR